MRRTFFRRCAAVVMAAVLAVGGGQPFTKAPESKAATKTITLSDEDVERIYDENFKDATHKRVSVHDPSIVVSADGGSKGASNHKYYIFGSHMAWAWSDDLENWTTFTNNINTNYETLFKKEFEWAAQGDSKYAPSGNMWAPDVIWNKSLKKWCMYMSINGMSWNSSICMLTADKLDGDWTYVGTVVYSGFTASGVHAYTQTDYASVTGDSSLPDRYKTNDTVWNFRYGAHAIDPCVYYDQDGKLRFVYGSWSGGIYTFELDNTTGFRSKNVTYSYENGASDPYMGIKLGGSTASGEAAYVQYINDKYYLFLSYGGLESTGGYNIRVFSSDSPEGPFVDVAGRKALSGGGTNEKIGNRLMTYYKWSFMDYGYVAQGHNSAFVDGDGKAYVVYHTRFDNKGETHEVRVHQLFQAQNKGLVTAPFEYSGETLSENPYSDDEIVGSYNVIAMESTNNSVKECKEESQIQLNEDGSVTGAYTGTWRQDEDGPYVTIRDSKNSVTYEGVFVEQKVEESSYKTLCFTVVGDNDISIWGYKTADDGYIYSDEVAVTEVVKNLTVSIQDKTYTDINLPTDTKGNVSVQWYTSNPDVISTDGTVTIPETKSEEVTLTLVVSKGNVEYEKDYETVVVSTEDAKPDIDTGLQAYYTFEDGLNDTVDTGNTAVAKALAKGTAPQIEESSDRNSKVLHQYFGYADAQSISYTEFTNPLAGKDLNGATVSVWVNREDTDIWDTVWSFFDENTSDNISGRVYLNPACYLGYNLTENGTNYWADINHPEDVTISDVTPKAWKLLTVTFSSDNAKIFVDGSLRYDIKNVSRGSTSTENCQKILRLISSSEKYYFGYGSWWGSSPLLLDNLRIYDRALSNADVAGIYDAEKVQSNEKLVDGSSYYFYDDYTTATKSTIGWVSTNAQGNLQVAQAEDSSYGNSVLFSFKGEDRTNGRSAYLDFNVSELSDKYTVEFDLNTTPGDNNGNKGAQYTQIALSSVKGNGIKANNMAEKDQYLWALVCDGGDTTKWYFEDNTTEKDATTNDNLISGMTNGKWIHVKATISQTDETAVVTLTGEGLNYEKTMTGLNNTSVNSLYLLSGRYQGYHYLDNFKIYTYDVAFDANDGTGTMMNQGFAKDATAPLSANEFTNDDKLFMGWAESKDGEIKYSDKEEVTNLATEGTKTLYAVWKNTTDPQKVLDALEVKKYTEDLKLSAYELPTGWTWENPDEKVKVGTNNYIALYDGFKYELSITVKKGTLAESEIPEVPTNIVGYIGNKLRKVELEENWRWAQPAVVLSAGKNECRIVYAKPNYEAVELTCTVSGIPSIDDVKFLGELSVGDIALPDGWSWNNPTEKITSLGDKVSGASYDGDNYNLSYTVVKGKYIVPENEYPSNLSGMESKQLNTINLPENWKWDDDTEEIVSTKNTYLAIYTEPSGNYEDTRVELEISIKLLPRPEVKYKEGLKLSDVEIGESGWSWKNPDTAIKTVGEAEFAALYNSEEFTLTVTVNKGILSKDSYTIPSDLSGVEGDALGGIELPADWSWSNSESILSAETENYQAVYTDVSGKYEDVTEEIPISVLALPTLEEVAYTAGLKLSNITLNSGWSWKTPDTEITSVGKQQYAIKQGAFERTVEISVNKGTLTVYTTPKNLSGTEGSEISTIMLPEGWKWKTATEKLTLDKAKYVAVYTDPSGNYSDVETELEVTVGKKEDNSGTGTSTSTGTDTDTKNGNTDGEVETTPGPGTLDEPLVGTTYTVGSYKYKVLSLDAKTVALTGVKKKTIKKVTVPKTVKIKGVTFRVTTIGASAFAKCKKLKKATIGANVTSIGKKAFFKDSKLKTITIKSKYLTKVGAKAFKGINKKAKIKVPKSEKKAYKKLLKKKGQAKTVKIK